MHWAWGLPPPRGSGAERRTHLMWGVVSHGAFGTIFETFSCPPSPWNVLWASREGASGSGDTALI